MTYDKALIASNIQFLRNSCDMTQAELALKLNYSDKAVSKWERGDSVPDIFVMKQIAEIFGVSLDFFFEEHSKKEVSEDISEIRKNKSRRNLIITLISVVGLWLLGTIGYITVRIITDVPRLWLIFPTCVPASFVLLLVFNLIWGKRKFNVYIISGLIWSVLIVLALWLSPLMAKAWLLTVIGIPGETVAILACRLGNKKEAKK